MNDSVLCWCYHCTSLPYYYHFFKIKFVKSRKKEKKYFPMDENIPAAFLSSLVGKNISVRSKWGCIYTGQLVSVDDFFNLQIKDAKEIAKETTELGEMLLRNNNILYIREDTA
ncbi:small nuclear ribonucleoprotein F [Angomonas deanei]|uniref:Sm protein F n=1 Tax=Angomonas deanei TaxID=59799 RepID=S9WGL4_9TRYP|nr:small nuclear ribonucleoprotein F [Angomonas deanei]EPY41707.1 small nuclear ribonucleoprotein F [Angomonas deanei]CAD2216573.1 LSM domain containing protein, putative [Angomonas deanei]|eukprot:EPY38361.1 small nuclear ribonucleoprotein F [Angomonas deanei]